MLKSFDCGRCWFAKRKASERNGGEIRYECTHPERAKAAPRPARSGVLGLVTITHCPRTR